MDKKHLKRKLFTLAPAGRECGCFNQFNYNHERGGSKNLDRGTESAMTDICKNDTNTIKQKQPSCLAASSPAASSDTNHSPLTTHHSLKRKTAFTLAEILITLGIIGIVAALTLPNLINNYKRKQLHTAFLRSSSLIQNALKETAFDYGYDNFKDFNKVCGGQSKENVGSCKTANAKLFEEISNDFISKFKVVRSTSNTFGNALDGKYIPVTSFKGTKRVIDYGGLYGMVTFNTSWNSVNFLNDGSVVSSITFFYHEPGDGLSFTFDTNGPYKGPNRYGYDIFLFNTGTWYKFCSQKSDGLGGKYNGRGCYDYALKAINPDDKTKKYWDSLEF